MTFIEDLGILMIGVTNCFIVYSLWMHSNTIIEMKDKLDKSVLEILGHLHLEDVEKLTEIKEK